jgi:hypothetical protein
MLPVPDHIKAGFLSPVPFSPMHAQTTVRKQSIEGPQSFLLTRPQLRAVDRLSVKKPPLLHACHAHAARTQHMHKRTKEKRTRQCPGHGPPPPARRVGGRVRVSTGNSGACCWPLDTTAHRDLLGDLALVVIEAKDRARRRRCAMPCRSERAPVPASPIARGRVCMLSLMVRATTNSGGPPLAQSLLSRRAGTKTKAGTHSARAVRAFADRYCLHRS